MAFSRGGHARGKKHQGRITVLGDGLDLASAQAGIDPNRPRTNQAACKKHAYHFRTVLTDQHDFMT
jgi:hypothetical protein